jgi:hypothetical protein
MINIQLLFLVLAFVCFLLAAIGTDTRIGLTPLGLAFWVLSLLISGASVLIR